MSLRPLLRILQFGTTGQLGGEMIRLARDNGISLQAFGSEDANFTRPDDVVKIVENASDIDVVVNAVAYTAVDRAETEEALATAINAETVGMLSRACEARRVPLIHVSTDYVFDGEKPSAYVESDAPNPLGVYGRTKLAGEDAIRESCSRHVILRTSWVYSAYGTNFVKTMLRLGAERDELCVVADQHGVPTAAEDLAAAICGIAGRLADAPRPEMYGIFNYTGRGATTWYEFARTILEDAEGWAGTHAKVVPITTAEYPTAARRPRNSLLDCAKIEKVYGIGLTDWRAALLRVLSEIRSQKAAGT